MPLNRRKRKCVKKSQPTTPWDETTDSDASERCSNSEQGQGDNIKQRLRGRKVSQESSFITYDAKRPVANLNGECAEAIVNTKVSSVKGKDKKDDIHGERSSYCNTELKGRKRSHSSANVRVEDGKVAKKPTYLLSDILKTLPTNRNESSSSAATDSPLSFKRKRCTASVMKRRPVSGSVTNTIQSSSPCETQSHTNQLSAVEVAGPKPASTIRAEVVKGRTRREARLLLKRQEDKVSSDVQNVGVNLASRAQSMGDVKSSSKGLVHGNSGSSQSKSHERNDVINLCISSDDESIIAILSSDDDDDICVPKLASNAQNHCNLSGTVSTRNSSGKERHLESSKPQSATNLNSSRRATQRQTDDTDARAEKTNGNKQVITAEVHENDITVEGSKHYIRHSPQHNGKGHNHSSIFDDTPMRSSGAKAASDVIIYQNGKPVGVNPNANVESLDGRFKRLLDQKRPMMRTLASLTDITQFYYVMKDSKGQVSKDNDSVAQFIIDIGIIIKDAGKELIYRGRSMQHDISSMRADEQLQIKQELDSDNSTKATKNPLCTSKGKAPETAEEVLRRRHVCQLCGMSYVRRENLETHLNRHADSQIVCTDCGKGFYSRALHRQHKQGHLYGFMDCSFCSQKFDTVKALRAHVKRHQAQTYVCTIAKCGKSYKDKDNFVQHVENGHNTERTVPCVVCGKFYKSAGVMRSHKSRDHKKKVLNK